MIIESLSACAERIPQVAAQLHAEWGGLARWFSMQAIAERLAERNQPDARTFTLVALDDKGEIAGTASVIHYELDDRAEREFWLGEVFTTPARRGEGIGSLLVDACIERARMAGISGLYLYTPDRQSLYRRLGWREIEVREVSGETVSVMFRKL